MKKTDTRTRSIVKSVTWRIIGIILLGIIVYCITGNWKEMTAITIVFHGIRFVMYYFHERIWEQIEWGKITHPLSGLPVTKSLEIEDAEIIKDKLKELGYID